MRVLLDENLPHDLIGALTGHSVSTVQTLGWPGTKNGALLKRASGLVDALVTMDRNLEHQQDVSGLPFGVVIVGAPSNRVPDLTPLVPEILTALDRVGAGKIEHVSQPRHPTGEGCPPSRARGWLAQAPRRAKRCSAGIADHVPA